MTACFLDCYTSDKNNLIFFYRKQTGINYIWNDFNEKELITTYKPQIIMNKSKVLIALLLVFLNFNFTSCEDEPVDPALLIVHEPETCAKPGALTVSNFVGTSVNLTWTAVEGASWEIQYGPQGFAIGSGTTITATAAHATINGLVTTNNYDFYVRTNCDNDVDSGWIGPVSVGATITACSTPTALTAVRSTTVPQNATITWAAHGDESSWQIQYGQTGFALNSGTTVSSAGPTTIITGLSEASGYDFYVRSTCSATERSSWAGPVHIGASAVVDTTPALMTANIDGTQFNVLRPYLYSVTGTDVIVTGSASSGDVRYLKIQGTDNDTSINLSNSREIDLHIPMSKWAPGTYVLHNDSVNTTEECWVSLLLFTTPDVDANVVTGTLTVTEFNTGTKRIKGTFSFSYDKIDSVTGASLGTFQVTNGTFNYGLDDPYFP